MNALLWAVPALVVIALVGSAIAQPRGQRMASLRAQMIGFTVSGVLVFAAMLLLMGGGALVTLVGVALLGAFMFARPVMRRLVGFAQYSGAVTLADLISLRFCGSPAVHGVVWIYALALLAATLALMLRLAGPRLPIPMPLLLVLGLLVCWSSWWLGRRSGERPGTVTLLALCIWGAGALVLLPDLHAMLAATAPASLAPSELLLGGIMGIAVLVHPVAYRFLRVQPLLGPRARARERGLLLASAAALAVGLTMALAPTQPAQASHAWVWILLGPALVCGWELIEHLIRMPWIDPVRSLRSRIAVSIAVVFTLLAILGFALLDAHALGLLIWALLGALAGPSTLAMAWAGVTRRAMLLSLPLCAAFATVLAAVAHAYPGLWSGPEAGATAAALGIVFALSLSLQRPGSVAEVESAERVLDDPMLGPLSRDHVYSVDRGQLYALLGFWVPVHVLESGWRAFWAARGESAHSDGPVDQSLADLARRLLTLHRGAPVAQRVIDAITVANHADPDLAGNTSPRRRIARLLAEVVEQSPIGLLLVDTENLAVLWNASLQSQWQLPPGLPYPGCPLVTLAQQLASHSDALQPEVLASLPAGKTLTVHTTEGNYLEIEVSEIDTHSRVLSSRDESGKQKALRALRMLNDSLEAQVAERTRELEQARLTAEISHLSRSRLMAATGHDLLQPLHAARLYAGMLQGPEKSAGEIHEISERIEVALRATEGLIEGLVDSIRLDAAGLEVRESQINLRDLLGQAVAAFAPVARQRGLALRMRCPAIGVRSDPALLRRVLFNLISNGLRYTREGGVLVGARVRGSRVLVQVSDTGIGIETDDVQRLFDEFSRGSRPSPWGERGLGLGLSVCRRIMGLLGSTLVLRSVPGRGSTFSLMLARSQLSAQPEAESRPRRDSQSLHGMRVLVLDDEQAACEATVALVRSWGVDASAARDIDSARLIARARAPHLILVDQQLPGELTGLDFIQLLSGDLDPMPHCLLVTASRSAFVQEQADALGIEILHKPVRPAILRAYVEQVSNERMGGARPSGEGGLSVAGDCQAKG